MKGVNKQVIFFFFMVQQPPSGPRPPVWGSLITLKTHHAQ